MNSIEESIGVTRFMDNKKVNNNVTLESRVVACCGSVNFIDMPKNLLPSLVENMENKFKGCNWIENYYLIGHNETDTLHIHYILELSGQKRLKTLLNDFEKFGYHRNAVNIDKLGFLSAHLRYFLHLDEESIKENKKIYHIEDIVSSMPYEYISDMISLEDDKMTTERLIQICVDSGGNLISIMKRLGLEKFHKWRNEINVILNYDTQLRYARDKERIRREGDNLPF